MSRRSQGVAVALAGMAGAALLLAGCSSPQASQSNAGGSAARSDVMDIGQDELVAQVQAFQAEINQPVNQPAPGLARATLERLIQDALIKAEAAKLDVRITPAAVANARAQLASQNGGEEQLVAAAHASGIPASAIDDVVRSNLMVSEIGKKLGTDGDTNGQLLAAQKAIGELAASVNVSVAPRYGVWDDATLSIKDTSTVTESKVPTTGEPGSPQPTAPAGQPEEQPGEAGTPAAEPSAAAS